MQAELFYYQGGYQLLKNDCKTVIWAVHTARAARTAFNSGLRQMAGA